MKSVSTTNPEGNPSMTPVRHLPWDSPAVTNRNIDRVSPSAPTADSNESDLRFEIRDSKSCNLEFRISNLESFILDLPKPRKINCCEVSMIKALSAAVEAPSRFLFRAIWEIQSYTFLSARAIANLFTRPIYGREVLLQMDRIGVGSLTIILLTGFFTGAVLGIQSESALRRYGATSIDWTTRCDYACARAWSRALRADDRRTHRIRNRFGAWFDGCLGANQRDARLGH